MSTFEAAGVFAYLPAASKICNNDQVELENEPSNKHDSQAIKIMCRKRLIGYVPRSKQTLVRDLMAKQAKFTVVDHAYKRVIVGTQIQPDNARCMDGTVNQKQSIG